MSRLLAIAAFGLALSLATTGALAQTTAQAKSQSPFSPAPKPVKSFDAGTLHVDQFGSGSQPVILIPGLGCGAWAWYGTIGKLAPKYSVYVITLPGFDGRGPVKEKPLFAAFTRDFWEILTAQKITKPVVIGHSLGGTLAIALAEQHSERLSAIVAVDGLPVFPLLADAPAAQRESTAAAMAKMFAWPTKEDQLAAQKKYMSTIGTNKPELVDESARLLTRSDAKALAAWMQEDLTNDLRPDLAKITIPFMEIMPYDPPAANQALSYTQEQTLAFYQSLVKGPPNAKVVAITPSRHFVMLDQPEAFYTALAEFLGTIQR